MEDEENELIVTDDVPETSEENVSEIETDTSNEVDGTQEDSTQVVQNSDEEIERQINERAEEMANELFEQKVEQRLIRDRINQNKKHNEEMEKYKHLEQIINSGLGTSNIDEAISKTTDFYKEQGINIPTQQPTSSLTERQEEILAKAEANDIKQCGLKEMENEANRIASIPIEKRTYQEKIILKELAEELISQRNIKELEAKGYDAKILNSEDFKNFKSKFSLNEPVTNIYEMYEKLYGPEKKDVPKSPGSAKSTASNSVKEFYTKEEVSKLTDKDLDDPAVMKAVEYSMTQWGKNSN